MALIPPLSWLARKLGYMDKPTERKQHKLPTPLVGGVAMFLGFVPSFTVFVGFADKQYGAIIGGALMILIIGLVDDYWKTRGKEFPVFPRVVVQLGAAALVFAFGIRFAYFTNPFTDQMILIHPVLQFVLTVLWIFGVTTVMNFSDGLDGLAGGFSGITAATFFILSIFMGQTDSAFMCAALIGCVIAFLRFNFFPTKTKIFMGDSGATFLGFLLAVISLHGAFKQATVVSMAVPMLALGVPIFDNIFVVIKRFLSRKPIYKADASQIHYRLMQKGLNPTQTVAFLFLVSLCLNLTSIIIMLL
jgi:UDP-N-acetylmuramyl pentapeptide phosphotransferase/UDP-N-acetylglucosamine-1-phosphate transferase